MTAPPRAKPSEPAAPAAKDFTSDVAFTATSMEGESSTALRTNARATESTSFFETAAPTATGVEAPAAKAPSNQTGKLLARAPGGRERRGAGDGEEPSSIVGVDIEGSAGLDPGAQDEGELTVAADDLHGVRTADRRIHGGLDVEAQILQGVELTGRHVDRNRRPVVGQIEAHGRRQVRGASSIRQSRLGGSGVVQRKNTRPHLDLDGVAGSEGCDQIAAGPEPRIERGGVERRLHVVPELGGRVEVAGLYGDGEDLIVVDQVEEHVASQVEPAPGRRQGDFGRGRSRQVAPIADQDLSGSAEADLHVASDSAAAGRNRGIHGQLDVVPQQSSRRERAGGNDDRHGLIVQGNGGTRHRM